MKLFPRQSTYASNIGVVPIGEIVYCGVCDEKTIEKRGVVGATSYLESVSRRSHKHDLFECPNKELDWHKQIVKLRDEIEKTASSTITKILELEVEDILKTRVATK